MAAIKLTVVLLLLPFLVPAQHLCGIFATREDFINNVITYQFDDCAVKLRMNKDIVAVHKGSRLKFDFRFIFGYTDGKDLYRAYGVKSIWTDQGYYKVIYDKDLIIYKRTVSDYRSNKQTHYYFSLSKDSPILPLRKKFYSSVKNNFRMEFSALRKAVDHLDLPGKSNVVLFARAGK
jgi:hypothetical protein